jgi:hypothetical protein
LENGVTIPLYLQRPGANARDLILGGPQSAPSVAAVAAAPQAVNVTVNAQLGTDAFGLTRVVVDAARQAARLNAGARRGTP